MALQTKGFVNGRQRDRKFSKHGAEFAASNAEEYERMADTLLGGVAQAHVYECQRRGGDTLRYDPKTESYGVLDASGTIRTCFKPIPCSSIRDLLLRATAINSGMCHGYANNLLYFQSQCRRLYGN